ncbi:hypothetical protein [Acidovorax sp.]|uniref:hypothetical protein n=1 Tax=Acidovorax sp. TaxID=1872122 RepID=UPI0026154C0C|nr:hypothetical protein [Acidovorax sp.]
MLTQIEWWGGLIFVLGALTYRLVLGSLEKEEEGFDWYRWQMHAFFLLPAVVLAAYFYPLESRALQYGYLGVLGVSLVLLVVMLVQEITGDGAEDGADKTAKAEKAQEEDENPGLLMTVVGSMVLYSPVLVACALGGYKAWPMVQQML